MKTKDKGEPILRVIAYHSSIWRELKIFQTAVSAYTEKMLVFSQKYAIFASHS